MRAILAQNGRRFHRLRIGARPGFGETERGDELAGRTARQIALFLCFRSEQDDSLQPID